MSLLLFVLVWAVVACGLHVHRSWYYKNHPLANARKGEGLIVFSETQWMWIMSFWPLAIVALILYAVLIFVASIIEWFINRNA